MDVAIEIKNVNKKYGERAVLQDLSFEVHQGECFGLLGPNGAGKSTTMKLMYGAAELLQGELYILGLNAKKNLTEIKRLIGVVPQDDGLDPEFSVLENLLVYSTYFSMTKSAALDRSIELLRAMRLEEQSDSPVEHLSGGMKRRLTIARALLNDPRVLFLDEPTTGLDLQSRIWLWESIKRQKTEGRTIVLTTHYMEEAESLCDRIAIIDHGRLLALGTPAELIRSHIGIEVVEFDVAEDDRNYYLNRIRTLGYLYQVIEGRVIVMIMQNQDSQAVLSAISSPRIQIRKPTLNDVFLKLAGSQLRDQG